MKIINYTDKVPLNINAGVAAINKGNASDWNEIKNALNLQVGTGWYNIGNDGVLNLTVENFDSNTRIGILNTNVDLTPYLSEGMKFKLKQNNAVKYGVIVDITSTQLTLYMGNDYSLNNSGISEAYFSMLENPYGFPQSIARKSLLQVGIGSNYNYSTGSVVTLPFTEVTQKIGHLFTLVGNKIVVGGNNVSGKCRVVCNLFGFNPSGVINYCYAYLYKNGNEMVDIFSAGAGNNNRFSLLMDVILDYQSGDEFELKIGGDSDFQLLATYYRCVMYVQDL